MKMILFASALAIATVAAAQPAPTTNPDAAASPSTVDPATTPAPGTPAPDAGSPPMTPPATPDASAPAMPGAPMPATPDASATASSTDDSNLPMCSKTVTDKCKQGGKGTMHHKKAMHHKM